MPSFFSTCANNLPSGEITAQTECPAFVSGLILIAWNGVAAGIRTGGITRQPMRMAKTTATPAKTVAFGCPLISLRSCSAVCEIYVSAEFHVSLEAWVCGFRLCRVADSSEVFVRLRCCTAAFESAIDNGSADVA